MFPIFQRILWPFNITEEDQACLFKLWGSNLSQHLKKKNKKHFKELVLELLAPICKREKSVIHSCGFFPPEVSLPVLSRWGCRQTFHEVFLPWLDLLCPLTTQAPYSSLLVLPPRSGGDAPGIGLMASTIEF